MIEEIGGPPRITFSGLLRALVNLIIPYEWPGLFLFSVDSIFFIPELNRPVGSLLEEALQDLLKKYQPKPDSKKKS